MLELTRHIWGGEDYVPHTWDDWMLDTDGILATAEFKARIVGLGKLTKLSEKDWWMEGLRVHPKFEGRGIASRLNDYLLRHWRRNGSGAVRLATISKREPVKHMVEKRGFKLLGEYATYQTQFSQSGKPTSSSSNFQPVELSEVAEALTRLTTPGIFHLDFGIMDLGWQFAPPRYEFIDSYAKEGNIWWWHNQAGLIVMVPKIIDGQAWARIRMFACKREAHQACILDSHAFAEQQGYAGVTWKVPLNSGIEADLTQVGYIQEKDYTLQIYEKIYSVDQ